MACILGHAQACSTSDRSPAVSLAMSAATVSSLSSQAGLLWTAGRANCVVTVYGEISAGAVE